MSCLRPEKLHVRLDVGHKLDRCLINTLGLYGQWVPVCPEVELGLSIPLETLRLVGEADNPHLIAPKSGADHTKSMVAWARKRAEELASSGLHGFVFKKDSPQPLLGSGVGAPAGISQCASEGIDAAESRVGTADHQ